MQGVELRGMSKNSSAAARGQRAAAGGRAFPLRAARFVEVHMHVDHAGEDVQAPRVDLLACAGQLRPNGATMPPLIESCDIG